MSLSVGGKSQVHMDKDAFRSGCLMSLCPSCHFCLTFLVSHLGKSLSLTCRLSWHNLLLVGWKNPPWLLAYWWGVVWSISLPGPWGFPSISVQKKTTSALKNKSLPGLGHLLWWDPVCWFHAATWIFLFGVGEGIVGLWEQRSFLDQATFWGKVS